MPTKRKRKVWTQIITGPARAALGVGLYAAGSVVKVRPPRPSGRVVNTTVKTVTKTRKGTVTTTVKYTTQPPMQFRPSQPSPGPVYSSRSSKRQRILQDIKTWTEEDEQLSGLHEHTDQPTQTPTWLQVVTRPIEPEEEIGPMVFDGDELTNVLLANFGGVRSVFGILFALPVVLPLYLGLKYYDLVCRTITHVCGSGTRQEEWLL